MGVLVPDPARKAGLSPVKLSDCHSRRLRHFSFKIGARGKQAQEPRKMAVRKTLNAPVPFAAARAAHCSVRKVKVFPRQL